VGEDVTCKLCGLWEETAQKWTKIPGTVKWQIWGYTVKAFMRSIAANLRGVGARILSVLPSIGLLVFGLVLGSLLAEGLVRMFHPTPLINPRWESSKEYGQINYSNVRMHHYLPGQWEYWYTVNEFRYRGRVVDPNSPTPKIVSLGDSYAFCIGVQDDETYAYQLEQLFNGAYKVVNLGNGAWGLPQHIRRYYNFGAQFSPVIVLLQYCSNDPSDGLALPIARWDADQNQFVFEDAELGSHTNRIRKFIRSIGGLHDFFNTRSMAYRFLSHNLQQAFRQIDLKRSSEDRQTTETIPATEAGTEKAAGTPASEADVRAETYYCELLTAFAGDLRSQGRRLIFFSVDGELEQSPAVKQCVLDLKGSGDLEFLDSREWFAGMDHSEYASPEGHDWGVTGHAIVAEQLFEHISSTPQP